jgi:hypothetical protein
MAAATPSDYGFPPVAALARQAGLSASKLGRCPTEKKRYE